VKVSASRRFLPLWTIEEHNTAFFIVRDITERGSLAKFAAMRRASSLVRSLAAERRPNSSSK
jgi:hypothetical protein